MSYRAIRVPAEDYILHVFLHAAQVKSGDLGRFTWRYNEIFNFDKHDDKLTRIVSMR